MNKQTGAEILVKSLENEGVEYIFGIPGEQTTPVMEELRKSDIEFVTTRHEQGAAFMADVYSRLSGNVGVCIATLGPGATNLVTGIGNASLDHSSVVAITSQRETTDQHKHSHQFVDTTKIFEAVTKLTDKIQRPETIPEQIRKSFEVASREKRGATHLELPLDVSLEKSDVETLDVSKNSVSPSGVQPRNIQKALQIIDKSENPIIIAGQGANTNEGSDKLTQFADKTGVPIVTTFMGKGSISDRSDRSVGTIGYSPDDYAMDAVKKSDMVLTVGYDYIEFHPDNWNIGRDKEIVHIDTTPPEIDKDYAVEMTLIGNIPRILEQMNDNSTQFVKDEYSRNLKSTYNEKMKKEYAENSEPPFKPQQVVRSIRSVLSDDDVLISDVGSHKYWFSRRYETYDPKSFIVSNGFASMGVALPGSVSGSLVLDSNVVAVTGDGGFLMNSQEIETAKRIGVDPTIIVLDDQEYTAISMEQNHDYGIGYGSSFENPKFKDLAQSFNVEGFSVNNSNNMNEKIKSAVQSNSVSVVSIPIDSTESYELESKF